MQNDDRPRCKPPGMFWTVRGASAIPLLYCQFNGRFEDYWEARPPGLTSTSMSRTQTG